MWRGVLPPTTYTGNTFATITIKSLLTKFISFLVSYQIYFLPSSLILFPSSSPSPRSLLPHTPLLSPLSIIGYLPHVPLEPVRREWVIKIYCRYLFCFILFYFILFYFVLFCFILFCFVLFCFVLFCFVLFCFVLFCFVLFCFVLFCVLFTFTVSKFPSMAAKCSGVWLLASLISLNIKRNINDIMWWKQMMQGRKNNTTNKTKQNKTKQSRYL